MTTSTSTIVVGKYARSSLYRNGICFPRAEIRDRACIDAAFAQNGHSVADVQLQCFGMLAWVLTQDGQLWLNDFTHGCGGVFVPQDPQAGARREAVPSK